MVAPYLYLIEDALFIPAAGKSYLWRIVGNSALLLFCFSSFVWGVEPIVSFCVGIIFPIAIFRKESFSPPANIRDVYIRVVNGRVYVNKRSLVFEDLIFLSFYQSESCSVIRLEAKRPNAFSPREITILANAADYEDALEVCRKIRDFIGPHLRICYLRIAKGKGRYDDGSVGSIEFLKREFLD